GAYFLVQPNITVRQLLFFGAPVGALLLLAMTYMLEFRGVGLENFSSKERHYDTLMVDYNIVNVSLLTQVFPDVYDYLGLEIPFNALIRPVPRAIWPGKPEGLSTSIEAALGASAQTTLSCTFVGEAYMAGGM